jgi:hypothetical protein
MWDVHVAIDGCLALYVAYLMEAKRRRDERVAKVRHLSRRPMNEAEALHFFEPVRAGASRRA